MRLPKLCPNPISAHTYPCQRNGAPVTGEIQRGSLYTRPRSIERVAYCIPPTVPIGPVRNGDLATFRTGGESQCTS